jgi:hypothetical protein
MKAGWRYDIIDGMSRDFLCHSGTDSGTWSDTQTTNS